MKSFSRGILLRGILPTNISCEESFPQHVSVQNYFVVSISHIGMKRKLNHFILAPSLRRSINGFGSEIVRGTIIIIKVYSQSSSVPLPLSIEGQIHSVSSVLFPCRCLLRVIFSQSVQFRFLASVHYGFHSVSQFWSVSLPVSTEGHNQSVSSVQFPC